MTLCLGCYLLTTTMSTFTANKLGTVFNIEAEVIDCALHSPHNSFTNTNDEYQVTVELPVTELINEFESIFRIHAHPSLPHENVWKQGEYRIRINTLVSPRMDSAHKSEEYKPGEMIFLACKPDLLVGDEKAIERLLLVGVNNAPEEVTDWTNAIDI